MKPTIEIDGAKVFLGDCRDVLKTLPDNSVDSVVTDPPYELGFMGKKWDSSGIAYDVSVWAECLRVLKPGGHVLAFGGSRTWHRLAVAVEDAGFEIRDNIAWIYGSGFPKSLDVSKAIDKGQGKNKERQLQFVRWMRSTGLTASRCDEILKNAGVISKTSSHSVHYFNDGQPQIATADMFRTLRPYLPEVPEEIERLVAERTGIEWTAYKQREVIGQGYRVDKKTSAVPISGATPEGHYDITAPATSEAQQWEGWGTALKPAHEPVVVGRKPLVGTVAENVLEWGVGGLNIDGSRIHIGENDKGGFRSGTYTSKNESQSSWEHRENGDAYTKPQHPQGRWPANVILDEVTAGLLDEQSGERPGGQFPARRGNAANTSFASGQETVGGARGMGDTGGASRFFYQAKASKRDRNEGLEELEAVSANSTNWSGEGMPIRQDGTDRKQPQKQNFHPTVKPTTLMRYLIKLVTPPGGTVLDPFTGSGSTGKAALLDEFNFIGAELTEEYLPIIEGRLTWATQQHDEETLF